MPVKGKSVGWHPAKTRSTYYTQDRVDNARTHIDRYEWARRIRDQAVANAEKYLTYGWDRLWRLITPPTLPRSFAVNYNWGSPVTGKKFNEIYGYRGWQADPKNEPWKLTDPSSGFKFPTNDFRSYYESGLDPHGLFDPKRANRRYLKNRLYPEKGEDWGVDDGFGWVDKEGNRWTFIAYYIHWHIWHGGVVDNALRAFRDAYLYTGDPKYCRGGIILLDRIADLYPQMNLDPYQTEEGYLNSHGGTGKGKIRGSIWEATAVTDYLSAYDAFFPGMEKAGVVGFLSRKAKDYRLKNPKDSVDAIRVHIENRLLREIFPAVKRTEIRGNFGMHQRALAMAAVVLDEAGTSEEWIDWIFQPGRLRSRPDWHLTGGNMLTTLVDRVDRDGFGDEPSTQYNRYWLGQIRGVADILERYHRYPKADLYGNVKFKKMFDTRWPLMMSGRYTPAIGDSLKTGNPEIVGTIWEHVKAFEKYRDPVYAQTAHFLNGYSLDGLHGDLFSADPEKIFREMRRVIEKKGELRLNSTHLPGFGFTALRDGRDIRPNPEIAYRFPDLKRLMASGEVTTHRGAVISETDVISRHVPDAFRIPEDDYETSGAVHMRADRPGERIAFRLNIPSTDAYVLDIEILHSTYHGRYQVRIDDRPLTELNFYGSGGKQVRRLGKRRLTRGTHTLTFVNRGKNKEALGYGLALSRLFLRNPQAPHRSARQIQKPTLRGLWMYYGRNLVGKHGHKDTLNIGLYGFGLDLSPDLGYPENFKTRTEWVSHTISHNTVVVDRGKQKDLQAAIPHHVEKEGRVQLIDVEAPHVYPQTRCYRRTSAMIRIDRENSYTVDFFRVKGGREHHFSFHGAAGKITTQGLHLIPQTRGTYAGTDVAFGEKEPDQPEGWAYAGSGFHYLDRVERALQPEVPFSVDWCIDDTWNVLPEKADIHLRLTLLNEVDEVALANGYPPKLPGNPDHLRYLIAHRKSRDLQTQFISVIEPYKNSPNIDSVRTVPLTVKGKRVSGPDTAAVQVVLNNGRTDYIVHSLHPQMRYTVDGRFQFQGFFGVYSERNGQPVYAFLSDGTLLQPDGKPPLLHRRQRRLTGKILDFTREITRNNQLTVRVKGNCPDPESFNGRQIIIENDGRQNATYTIQRAERNRDNVYTLHLGDTTLIRQYKNPKNISKGYRYNIKKGAQWTLPLSSEWYR
ncbi:heparinase II/III domain-containing protein [Paludifilum halophilum]|uniref:Heparinase II/III-like C-terminal domain-containing protein n=1 Tax=Paludifilum halophilum TaxID=1642702 RepID=A0A235B894_9BACL|nr:heparinase II/III family protein [Paludifilum halophilum]OYD08514.1 hypothetical protein CHM34_06720 [Paludifilum halophilum]